MSIEVLEELKQIDALIWVALTTGGTDIDADLVARSLAEFRQIVFEKISKIDGVQSTEASLMVDLVSVSPALDRSCSGRYIIRYHNQIP